VPTGLRARQINRYRERDIKPIAREFDVSVPALRTPIPGSPSAL